MNECLLVDVVDVECCRTTGVDDDDEVVGDDEVTGSEEALRSRQGKNLLAKLEFEFGLLVLAHGGMCWFYFASSWKSKK